MINGEWLMVNVYCLLINESCTTRVSLNAKRSSLIEAQAPL